MKAQIVRARGFENLKLNHEHVAEFVYRPARCEKPYRMVVIRKNISRGKGETRLIDEIRYFFYITNDRRQSASNIVFGCNDRCNQENLIAQLSALRALHAPVDNLTSNWAYMVFASLGWTLKQWCGMMIRVQGNPSHRAKQESVRRRVIRMEFATFLNSIMLFPAQVIKSARQTTFRLLNYRPTVECLLMLHDRIGRPLRC